MSVAEHRDLIALVSSGAVAAGPRFDSHYVSLRAGGSGADQDLLDELASAAKHSPNALELLLRVVRVHGLARPAIRRMIVDADSVDDVEQATLACIAVRMSSFEGRSRFTTWLHAIAGNEAKLLLRSRARRPVADHGPMVEQTYLARLSTLLGERDAIERAIQRLPPSQREVLIAREIEGYDYAEIGSLLGLPIGTVRSRLHRAREMVASQLREGSET